MSPLKDFVYCCKQRSICLVLSSGIGHVLFCQDIARSVQEIAFDQGLAEFDIKEKRKRIHKFKT